MQYRLSTLFLIFFVFATSLAAFKVWGIGVATLLCLAALSLNRAGSKIEGLVYAFIIFFGGIVCCVALVPAKSVAREAARRANCCNNMKQIGLAVLNYENARKQFPPLYGRDKEGKKLFSWLVNLIPHMEYEKIYDRLKRDESWNSQSNQQVLTSNFTISEFRCPSAKNNTNSSNYLAIIGPGTIWQEEGCKTKAELPHGMSNAIVAVETVDLDKHWAEPFALTVDEVLENMKTGKGVRISSCHRGRVQVLFADGVVRQLPSQMPLSLWRKILNEGIDDFDKLEDQIDPDAPDMIDVSVQHQTTDENIFPQLLSIGVWLFSIVWLFACAIQSRKITPQASADAV